MYRDKLPSNCIFRFPLGVALQQAFSNPANSIETSKLPPLYKRTQPVVKLGACKEKMEFIQQMGGFPWMRVNHIFDPENVQLASVSEWLGKGGK